jgi:hypothetical protein
MWALALFAAASAAASPRAAPQVQATATVRIIKAVAISASALSVEPQAWRETEVRLPDGSSERVRIVEFQ